MVKRSLTRALLLFGMAVALAAHLWMLHDPMPPGQNGSAAESYSPAAFQTAPGPDGQDSATPFMALTCLAVLLGAATTRLVAAMRRARPIWPNPIALPRVSRRERVSGWRRVGPPSRVDAGVLLLV